MPKAVWNNAILAESDETEFLEGNHYFPPESLNREYFRDSDAQTVCAWKGVAKYYDVVVEKEINDQAAWYYPEPKAVAEHIQGYVAFWRGVRILA